MSLLDSLGELTLVVADSCDLDAITRLRPREATTNPSLLRSAVESPRHRRLIEGARRFADTHGHNPERFLDRLSVDVGIEILGLVPGRVSTEVDARLAFDTRGTIEKARTLVGLYRHAGVDRERVLIKIPATWEGIRAAELLEREGIHCNLTLVFALAQGVACADAAATVVSPFVGRITDWHRRASGGVELPGEEDPGVAAATRIYAYLKHFGYRTKVMAASLRTLEQVLALAGCDLITLSPVLLSELAAREGGVERKLSPRHARESVVERVHVDEKAFRWLLNEDPMAVELLADGIRRFDRDARRLEALAQPGAEQSHAA
jgi:transaldolase